MSSSHQIEQSGDTKQFTVTVFLAFVAVFIFVLLVSQWHGDFKAPVPGAEVNTSVEK